MIAVVLKVAQRFSAAIAGLPPSRRWRFGAPRRSSLKAIASGGGKACATFSLVLGVVASAGAQSLAATRLNILQAEDRRAPTANDVAILRAGARSGDPLTARMGLRALGRLERPSLIPDITPGLRHPAPENRVEAATALGQAAQGWKREPAKGAPAAVSLDSIVTTLVARMKVDDDVDVRAAICETLGRLPYTSATQAGNAERALLDMAARAESVTDRLGVAKGFEALVRLHRALRPPSAEAITVLRRLAAPGNGDLATGARIRRLAFESLVLAGSPDADLLEAASHDPDPQVRRLAMRVVATRGRPADTNGSGGPSAAILPTDASWATWLKDDSPIVRLEALRALRARGTEEACPASILGALDRDPHVALLAIDQLSACGGSPVAVALLEYNVEDRVTMQAPRGWHRAAHAIVALAGASPKRAAAPLQQLAGAQPWQMRMYAARAAAVLKDRALLERLAKDESDNVCEVAIGGLKTVAGHDADAIYLAALPRTGYQAVRAAAAALDGSPRADEASAALKAAHTRLIAEGRDNSHDARDAIAKTLASLTGHPAATSGDGRSKAPQNDLNADDMRRLAAPRARITIRDVGTFELALFTAQAPATVLRFARLAEAGYYNGLTFHRVVPNFVIQGGSPGANEYVGDAAFMRDELGSWPHVRGAVGISTRGRDTGDAQIFVDLVDNPRLDHDYTVFAQVLNGIDVVDRILEGDVIERIEIVTGR
jgi:cyclophilin family peptidyl-prolyl cis-trans isomerase